MLLCWVESTGGERGKNGKMVQGEETGTSL